MKCPESANVMTDSASFCCVWPLLEGDVEKGIRRCLRARMVSGPRGQADLAALDDIRQEVALKVMKMCSRGMFHPQESAKPRLGALKAYVASIVRRETVNYCRTYRNSRRKTKVLSMTAIDFNTVGDSAGGLERQPAKVSRPELWSMIKQGINELPSNQAELVRLKYETGMPERQVAKVVGISAATVNRRLQKAYEGLRTILSAKGIEFSFS